MSDNRTVVMRPANPQKALDRAEEILKIRDKKAQSSAFDNMLEEQPYTIMGFLHGYNIVDKDNKIVGRVEPGDSFATIDAEPLLHAEAAGSN